MLLSKTDGMAVAIAVGVVGFTVVAASAAPMSMNLGSALAPTKALLASGQSADVLVLGDSLSFRTGSYLPYFRDLMQGQYGDGGTGYLGASIWSDTGFNQGWSGGVINADVAPYRGLDGLWNTYQGTAGFPNQAAFNPTDAHTTLYYATQPGGGSVQVRDKNFSVVTTLSADGPAGVSSYTYPTANEGFQLLPVQNSGPFTLLGRKTTSDEPGIRINRAANGGWGINNFLQRDFTFDEEVKLLGTDLVMVWLGQNDQGFNRTTYAAKLNLLVDRLQADVPDAQIVLVGTYDQGSPALAGLVEAMADVASNRNLGFINIYEAGGDRSVYDANGYLDDNIHFSPAGGQYVGNILYNAFVTDGASLPEPGSCSALGAASLLLARRRRR